MTDITIPDAAVEAAAHAMFEVTGEPDWTAMEIRQVVEAAAPHIAAQALRDLLTVAPESGRPPTPFTSWREWIAARADRIKAEAHG